MQDNQTIAYISDVGAAELKPLFVAGCIITTIFLDLSFGSDRWLRHKGRLVPNTSRGEKILSGLTILFAIIGTVGLTCLSGFDTAHYPIMHDIFLLLFIGGYLISAIFICWEYQRLGISEFLFRSLRYFHRSQVPNQPGRKPRPPHPTYILLDQARLRRRRAHPRHRIRGL